MKEAIGINLKTNEHSIEIILTLTLVLVLSEQLIWSTRESWTHISN